MGDVLCYKSVCGGEQHAASRTLDFVDDELEEMRRARDGQILDLCLLPYDDLIQFTFRNSV